MKPYLIPFFATVALTATAQQKNEITSVLEILDVTNGNRTVVKEFPYRIEAPNWTPDGQWLLYNSDGKLYRLSPTSPAEPELINTGFAQNCNNDHVLSADGQQIAISHGTKEDYKSRIYTLPITGGTPRLITPMAPSYLHGWSPDGKELAYCAERNGNYDVYTIPAEGGEETRLTTAEGLDDGPEYSPCGQYIWFNSVRTGLMQVWRMKADGSEQTQMTFDETRNSWFPHISPDGKSVVFITYYKGDLEPGEHLANKNVELRLMPANGGEPKTLLKLFGGQGTINVNSWAPDSKRIAGHECRRVLRKNAKRAPEVLEPGTLRQSHRHRNDPDGSLHPRLHRRGRDKQQSRKTNGGRALHQPPAHRHASASRPYHQICLAGLRLAENYECPSGSRIPLQYLSQHRTTSRSHTHPLTHRAGCCAEPYETQLPLHVCQRGLLGHP